MADTRKFWNKHAERYSKSPVRDEDAYQKKLEITRKYFTPGSEVFEFGCGTGTTAIYHAPYVKHILATDISDAMLEIARSKATDARVENITFQQTTIEDFDGADESFDVVMAHNILHLLQDPEAAMKKIYRLLKPGGALVTSTVCLGDMALFWRLVLPIAKLLRLAPYVNVMTRESLEQLFENTGFETEYHWEPRKNQAAFIISRKPAH